MPIDIPDEVEKRLSAMVTAVGDARRAKDMTQVEARFQDLRAYCDDQMRVRKSVIFPLKLAAASSDMDQQIGFIEEAVVVSRQTGEKIPLYLYQWGVRLMDWRPDDARKLLIEARDTATGSGEEIIVTNATFLLRF